ncbi:hypothetical protein KIW84_070132 [Lathyrus oleraceus]|uniref:Uncharacterized protein n=1 Tax=Pisum sativum TaxID=3888 RepID=A0A9D4VEV5_PEA|nr:hypothetical protein KIW84_070132 [Pisum sativum]
MSQLKTFGKTPGKSSASESTIPSEDKTFVEEDRISIDKELRKLITSVMKGVDSNVFPDVQTYLAKETSLEGDSSEKADEYVPKQVVHERRSKKKDNECVPEQVAHERMSNKKVDYGVNIDDLTTDKEPLTNILALGIDKRLQRRKGKVVMFEDSLSWSKVVTPTRKRKVVSSSDSEFEIEEDVCDITHIDEEEKEVEHGGDDNVGDDVEDSIDGNIDENDEDKES